MLGFHIIAGPTRLELATSGLGDIDVNSISVLNAAGKLAVTLGVDSGGMSPLTSTLYHITPHILFLASGQSEKNHNAIF